MTHARPDPDPYDVEREGLDLPGEAPAEQTEQAERTVPGPAPAEPVAAASVVSAVVGVLVMFGWASADDPLWPLVGTAAGAAVTIWTILRARAAATEWPLRPDVIRDVLDQHRGPR